MNTPSPQRFILIASQRTGSNILNRNLNQFEDIVMHGEILNPAFVGLRDDYYAKLSMKRDQTDKRENNRKAFVEKIFGDDSAKAVGFHIFDGHAPDLLPSLFEDKTIKKIWLRRNLIASFVSLLEARATNSWLVSASAADKAAKTPASQVEFSQTEFSDYRSRMLEFSSVIEQHVDPELRFDVFYSKVNDIEVGNNIANFLGINQRLDAYKKTIVKQARGKLKDRVKNFEQLKESADNYGIDISFM